MIQPITAIKSRTVVIASGDIDTDQIIPARFLTTTTKDGLGAHLFADWRYQADGAPKREFVLNRPEARDAAILVAGPNFGCGSSREHAPWALLDYGFRAIISSKIADIFCGNALMSGLLPVVVDEHSAQWLLQHSGVEVEIDIDLQQVRLPTGATIAFSLDPFARHCLLNGLNELEYLRSRLGEIERYEAARR